MPECLTGNRPVAVNIGVIFLQSSRFAIHLQKNEGGLVGFLGCLLHHIQVQKKSLHSRKENVYIAEKENATVILLLQSSVKLFENKANPEDFSKQISKNISAVVFKTHLFQFNCNVCFQTILKTWKTWHTLPVQHKGEKENKLENKKKIDTTVQIQLLIKDTFKFCIHSFFFPFLLLRNISVL